LTSLDIIAACENDCVMSYTRENHANLNFLTQADVTDTGCLKMLQHVVGG